MKQENAVQDKEPDKKSVVRNRRMFGMIMGTLQKFQSEETQRKVVVSFGLFGWFVPHRSPGNRTFSTANLNSFRPPTHTQTTKREEIEKKLDKADAEEKEAVKKERQSLIRSRKDKQTHLRALEMRMERVEIVSQRDASQRPVINRIANRSFPLNSTSNGKNRTSISLISSRPKPSHTYSTCQKN